MRSLRRRLSVDPNSAPRRSTEAAAALERVQHVPREAQIDADVVGAARTPAARKKKKPVAMDSNPAQVLFGLVKNPSYGSRARTRLGKSVFPPVRIGLQVEGCDIELRFQ